MRDDLKVPSFIFKELCIFGVVLIACQGKLFPLCYSCEALNNPRDWLVEEGPESGFCHAGRLISAIMLAKSRFTVVGKVLR
ncbi:hypothetical protein QZH47_22335 [Pseudomonas corrugata]